MNTDKDNSFDVGCGCFFAFWLAMWILGMVLEPDCGVAGSIVIILSIVVYIKLVYNDKKQSEIERKKQQEEEKLIKKRAEEIERLEKERLAKIADLTQRPLKTLLIDELSLLGSEFKDDEAGKEKFFKDAIRSGSLCAAELLVQQAEKRNQRLTPRETIKDLRLKNSEVKQTMQLRR